MDPVNSATKSSVRASILGVGTGHTQVPTIQMLFLGAVGIALSAIPLTARAEVPAQALRMSGVEPQGPASRAVSALHHNPAMLGALQASAIQVSVTGGIEQLRVQRYRIDPLTGGPVNSLSSPVSVFNPKFAFFTGASVYFDPVAFGVGYYDLSSQLRFKGSDTLGYHLADSGTSCLDPTLGRCAPTGGAVSSRQDLTAALAINRGRFQLGLAVHFPRARERFAFDNDSELQPFSDLTPAVDCTSKEDPLCAERVGFKGWAHWLPDDGGVSAFDAAITVGVAFELRRDRITLGARYRSAPLAHRGEIRLSGVSVVCRPVIDSGQAVQSGVPPCDNADLVEATLTFRLPQEVAIGSSFQLGRNRSWRVDTNLYWIDLCPGGTHPGHCNDRDVQTLRIVGLDRAAVVPAEIKRYRGFTDIFGIDAYAAYRIRSNLAVLVGAQVSSPSVRHGAQTSAIGEGWRVGLSAGTRFRDRRTGILISPGYAFDLSTPRDVTPGQALYDPIAATAFAASSGDLNGDGGDAVLEGRARSTNAGHYLGLTHTLSLTLGWSDGARVLE